MGPARRNKARRPPSEPEQKAGTPVHTQGRTAEGFHRRRRQAQPVPSPGLRLPELFQTERFIGVYHTPIFIKMQSFFSEIAWNSTQKLPAVRLHRQTKGARAPPMHRFNLLRNLGQQQPPQLFPQPQPFPQPQEFPQPPLFPQQQQRMMISTMIHRQPPPPQLLLQHPILKYPLKMKI